MKYVQQTALQFENQKFMEHNC